MSPAASPSPSPTASPTAGPGAGPALPRRAAILGGDRTPFSRAGRRYAQESSQDLLTAAIDGLVARFSLQGERMGEVVAGAVLRHSRDLNLTREAVLSSALDPTTPTYDVAQACATGLEAAVLVANKIALGQIEVGIAGGADSASDAPVALDDDLRRVLLAVRAARTPRARLAALARLRPSQVVPELPRNGEPRTGLSMGEHAAITAARWGITREDQDRLALDSHRHLAAAYERGFFDDLVTPHRGLVRDDTLRPDTTAEALAGLRPVFGGPGGTMTAGNSTPLTDGASAVLLASDAWAAEHRLPVLAHLVDAETAAVDFVHGDPEDSGLLTAPVHAVPRLLDRLGMTLADFDLYEVHEAFASTVLATLAAWEDEEFCARHLGRPALGPIDRTKLNTAGSSLATGHPFAATGGRILATTAKLLAEVQRGRPEGAPRARALVSLCAAGGQGVVAVVEAA